MDFFEIISAPLVGGFIGYITNSLAIKMLFRPRKAIYIGKWHVPFTPGLIPQQKERIAMSIGRVVSGQLLSADTIKKAIVTEATLKSLKDTINGFLDKLKDDPRTVEDILIKYVEPERITDYKERIKDGGTELLMKKIVQGDLGTKMVQQGIDVLKEKMQNNVFGMFVDETFYKGIEKHVGKMVNETIIQKAPELIREEMSKLEEEVLGATMGNIYEMQQKHMPVLADNLVSLYQRAIDDYLEDVLKKVDIENIVAEKVSSFDAVQLEEMIFDIMRKELNAIVYLGAVLGFFMGFVNILW